MRKFNKALVLGSSGMLGSTVLQALEDKSIKAIGLNRQAGFDLSRLEDSREQLLDSSLDEASLLVNCIGWIPQRASGNLQADTQSALVANSVLPNILEEISEVTGAAVIQILTDCVFSGSKGGYLESDTQDASDLYGLTKRLGEFALSKTMGVRCSIVGFSIESGSSLFDWFLSQPIGTEVNGFTNHFWNGVTTQAFAALVLGVFNTGAFSPGKYHWLPSDSASKFQLLKTVQGLTGRSDLVLSQKESDIPADRRLSTSHPEISQKLWQIAGYAQVPSILELVAELVNQNPRFSAKEKNDSHH